MMKLPTLAHNYGDIVYLVTDEDQCPRIVTGILIEGPQVQYQLTRVTQVSYHHEVEIIKTPDLRIRFGVN